MNAAVDNWPPYYTRRTRVIMPSKLSVLSQGDDWFVTPQTVVGSHWYQAGGLYAGSIEVPDGDPYSDYYLILGEREEVLSWTDAVAWATSFNTQRFDTWTLPSRYEMQLLYAGMSNHFEAAPYWTRTPLAWDSSEAYVFSFGDASVSYEFDKTELLRARAVRRLPTRRPKV